MKTSTEKSLAIAQALNHVTLFYPTVCQVFYGIDGSWFYCDEHFNSPVFDDRIDLSLLKDAADYVYDLHGFPFAFSINNC